MLSPNCSCIFFCWKNLARWRKHRAQAIFFSVSVQLAPCFVHLCTAGALLCTPLCGCRPVLCLLQCIFVCVTRVCGKVCAFVCVCVCVCNSSINNWNYSINSSSSTYNIRNSSSSSSSDMKMFLLWCGFRHSKYW
jgi:hypothetical protein